MIKLIIILLLAAGAAKAAEITNAWFKDKECRELAEKVMKYRPGLLKTPGRRLTAEGLLAWGVHTARSAKKKDILEAKKIAELLSYKEVCEYHYGAQIRATERFTETFEDDLDNPKVKRNFHSHTEMVVRGIVFGVELVGSWQQGNTVVRVYRVTPKRKGAK